MTSDGRGVARLRHKNYLVMIRKSSYFGFDTHFWWHKNCWKSRDRSVKNRFGGSNTAGEH